MRYSATFFILGLAILTVLPPSVPAADDMLSAAANQSFLAANSGKPGVIALPSGLQYRILRRGPGKRPSPTDTVQVAYSGRLIDGTVIDGTSPGLPASLTVGNTIQGLREALLLMHEGDRWQLVLPPNLAFGAHGTGNGAVPPNQALVFDMSLVSIVPAARRDSNSSGQVTLSAATKGQGPAREQGALLTIPQ